jgi:hypothetical protein
VAVLFWDAKMYQDITMPVKETWWGNPAKTILPHVKKPNTDLVMYYDPTITDWRLTF